LDYTKKKKINKKKKKNFDDIGKCWIFAVLWWPFWKWRPVEIFQWPPQYRTNSTLFDFNILNWFLTLKNFYRSPFSNWPTQYQKFKVAFNLFFKPEILCLPVYFPGWQPTQRTDVIYMY
jgi:hypothetical protein